MYLITIYRLVFYGLLNNGLEFSNTKKNEAIDTLFKITQNVKLLKDFVCFLIKIRKKKKTFFKNSLSEAVNSF